MNCNGDNIGVALLVILAIAIFIVIMIGALVGLLFLIQIGAIILTRRMSILRKKHELIDYEVIDVQNQNHF